MVRDREGQRWEGHGCGYKRVTGETFVVLEVFSILAVMPDT